MRVIYKYALDRIAKHEAQELFKNYTIFEKKFGDRRGIEDIIVSKRRFQYEEEVKVGAAVEVGCGLAAVPQKPKIGHISQQWISACILKEKKFATLMITRSTWTYIANALWNLQAQRGFRTISRGRFSVPA